MQREQSGSCSQSQGSSWGKKQKKCYHRIKSGIARHGGEILRFLTLTTSPQTDPRHPLGYYFQLLVKRIRRRWTFKYIKIETWEGVCGVLHILFYGDFIPHSWLSRQWSDIAGAPNVWIKKVSPGRAASYVVSQYCTDQGTYFKAYSWCQDWLFRGAVGVWLDIVKKFGYGPALEFWRGCMQGALPESEIEKLIEIKIHRQLCL